jgi:hypothetical protein
MADVQYIPLSALRPLEFEYTYNISEPLIKEKTTYDTGLQVNTLQSTSKFQDISFNNETCLILTSSVNLSSFFTTKLFENNFFGSVHLKPRISTIYYVSYNSTLNSLYLSPSATQIYISPVSGTNEVELIVERKYIQVDQNYPYEIQLTEKTLDPESTYRQRFICTIQGNTVGFKTKTDSGYRYLGFCSDGVLRATGTVLNNSVINDYIFNIEYVAVNTGIHGFIPVNDYVTYYFDKESASNNENLAINKTFDDNPNNFLLSFTFENIKSNNNTNINIANLKNVVTPAGGLATVDNSYTKTPIKTN